VAAALQDAQLVQALVLVSQGKYLNFEKCAVKLYQNCFNTNFRDATRA